MSILNATELFTFKWLILCYMDFASIKKYEIQLSIYSHLFWSISGIIYKGLESAFASQDQMTVSQRRKGDIWILYVFGSA